MVIGWTENGDEHPPSDERPKVRAAIYVRMSTERQKYSTDNQIAAIERCPPSFASKSRGHTPTKENAPDILAEFQNISELRKAA